VNSPATGVERFINAALSRVEKEPSFGRAIHITRFLGEVLWKNATGHYQLADLERLLIERIEPDIPVTDHSRQCRFGHVLTKAYDTGGHTRVVERLVVCEALIDSAVVVTESAAPKAQERLGRARHGCTVVPSVVRGRERIAALVAAFVRFDVLVLYVHPHDIESVVAAGIARQRAGVTVLFYNHADHVFSYGYGVADRVLELGHFGWALRAARKCTHRSVFVGIPLALPSALTPKPVLPGVQRGAVVAAGTAYKFRPALGWSFPAFVQSLCQKSDCRVEIVGPSAVRDWWWWPVLRSLKGRVSVHARLEHDKYLAFMSDAAAYVDSFPMVGGTAFAEVMAQGVPCFGVLTGTHGYSPADGVKSLSVDELTDEVARFMKTGDRHDAHARDVFVQLHEAHDAEAVASRIAGAVSIEVAGQAPPWPCQREVDAGFYERMWLSGRFPTVPVHVLPPLSLVFSFLMLKWKSNA
jgi:hypothetical protein